MAIVVFEHSKLANVGRLGEALRTHGHQLQIYKLYNGDEVPQNLNNVDAVISCGGATSAIDDSLPWLKEEMDYLIRAHDSGIPIVGICLGSQILARTFGGKVAKLDSGIELGWHALRLSNAGHTDTLFVGLELETKQLHWHSYYAQKLPDDATLLASSDSCPVQAWTMGGNIYAFQFHPEVNRHDIIAWADDKPEELEEQGITREELLEQTDEYLPEMMRVADRLFEAIAMKLLAISSWLFVV